MRGDRKEAINQVLSAIVAIGGNFKFERVISLLNSIFPFPLATAFWIGIVMTNRRSAANFFTFLKIGADIFISWIGVAERICRMIFPFTLHRLIKKLIISANNIGAVITDRNILTPLRLFVVTMPIQKAVASGNGNIEFYRETTRSNLK